MSKKPLFRYLIELVIVIAGVTIAFWLNTRAEAAKEQKILDNYYVELLADLDKDRKKLDWNIETNTKKKERMISAVRLYLTGHATRDSVYKYCEMIGNYDFFYPKDITYRSMVSSGDLKLITNFDIKRKMISLYDHYELIEELQENHLQALDKNYFPKYVYMVDFITQEVVEPIEEDMLIKNYFGWCANDLSNQIGYYQSAMKRNLALDSLIKISL